MKSLISDLQRIAVLCRTPAWPWMRTWDGSWQWAGRWEEPVRSSPPVSSLPFSCVADAWNSARGWHWISVETIVNIVHWSGYAKMAQTVERWTVNREAPGWILAVAVCAMVWASHLCTVTSIHSADGLWMSSRLAGFCLRTVCASKPWSNFQCNGIWHADMQACVGSESMKEMSTYSLCPEENMASLLCSYCSVCKFYYAKWVSVTNEVV